METIVVIVLGFFTILIAASIIRFAIISTVKFIRLSLTLLAIIFLTQLISLGVFEPFYSQAFQKSFSTGSDVISNFISFGVFTSIIVLIFGQSIPFKLYGIISIIINMTVIFFIMLIVYGTNSYDILDINLTNSSKIDSFTVFSIYLNSLNISTFFLYGYDKFRAWIFPKSKGTVSPQSLNHWSQKLARWFHKFAPWIKPPRVPEWILHWHTIFGGTIGAFFAQRYFRHKTKSNTFQPVFITSVIIQIILLIVIGVASANY